MTATYYAVCNANGPISIQLNADSVSAALDEFERLDRRAAIDDGSCDAEDDLGFNGASMDEDEFEAELSARGCLPVQDLDTIINAQAGTVAHLAGGWYLWACANGAPK